MSLLEDLTNEFNDAADMEPSAQAESYGGNAGAIPRYNWESQIPSDILEQVDEIFTDKRHPADFLRHNVKKLSQLQRHGGANHHWKFGPAFRYPNEVGNWYGDQTDEGLSLKDYIQNTWIDNDVPENWRGATHERLPADTFATETITPIPENQGHVTDSGHPRLDENLANITFNQPNDIRNRIMEYNYQQPWRGDHGSGETFSNSWNWNQEEGNMDYYNGERLGAYAFYPDSSGGGGATGPTTQARPDTNYNDFFQPNTDPSDDPGFKLTGLTDLFSPGSVARSLTEAGDKGTAYNWAPTISKNILRRLRSDYYTPQLKQARHGLIDDYQKNLNYAQTIGKGLESYGGRNRMTAQANKGYKKEMSRAISDIGLQKSEARQDVNNVLNQWRDML